MQFWRMIFTGWKVRTNLKNRKQLTSTADSNIAIDLVGTDYYLRDDTRVRDQNGLSAHPGTVIH